jgi:hypothetical protein
MQLIHVIDASMITANKTTPNNTSFSQKKTPIPLHKHNFGRTFTLVHCGNATYKHRTIHQERLMTPHESVEVLMIVNRKSEEWIDNEFPAKVPVTTILHPSNTPVQSTR